jgi:dienelactone hydrolase
MAAWAGGTALGVLLLLTVPTAILASGAPAASSPAPSPPPSASTPGTSTGAQRAPARSREARSFAVGLRVLRLVDHNRTITPHGGAPEPRPLVTYVRYPALGAPGRADVLDATPARGEGPYPLVVFGHGFGVTPEIYAPLLRSWARAGYVVAAPVFPLGNAATPGGPEESDVINQPRDMSFVISSLLSLNDAGAGSLAGVIDPAHIAVAGHSDGAETALAAAYSRRFRDRRIRAAVILSGAMISGVGGYSFAAGSPPLLAAQGTADTSNEPRFTNAYFERAGHPKYLLRLLGAAHLPPYTGQQRYLAVVERVTIAFLDSYLADAPDASQRLRSLGNVPGVSSLLADP